MYEMKVQGEMTAVRLPDGSSGRFTGDIAGLYQGYREVGPPEQRAEVPLEHGSLSLVLRYEVPHRPTGERTENPFADGKDPYAGLTLIPVTRPNSAGGQAGPPPWMQAQGGGPPPGMQGEGGGPPPWMQGQGGGPPPGMQGQGGGPPVMEGQGDPSKWGAGRAVVAHEIKLEIDGDKSTGIYSGASGEMTVEAPNHKTAGFMNVDTDKGRVRLNFLEYYDKGQLVANLWADGEKSTGVFRRARGDLEFSLGFYAAMDPAGSGPPSMCAQGTYSGTLWLEDDQAGAATGEN
jgi:hypothetical protein